MHTNRFGDHTSCLISERNPVHWTRCVCAEETTKCFSLCLFISICAVRASAAFRTFSRIYNNHEISKKSSGHSNKREIKRRRTKKEDKTHTKNLPKVRKKMCRVP